ncbi:hypothetical protein SISNIDRAFT_485313 [Sistotremastrum niveocremeum HHB9708]|uniref:F-box domain-containing protein n=1 Tax=Sistotremastrum niveocremeum HHB9708 TaxID=1314777 RepID=A0A164V0D3_9AGAM|nr:hypothetical protein SISNIDRAFT_485313 [Sistotremastrum niveocremeum HHB9708]
MSFNKLSEAILFDIMRLAIHSGSWEDKLAGISTMRRLNSRFNRIGSTPSLWNTVDVAWPKPLIKFFLSRSKGYDLILVLKIEEPMSRAIRDTCAQHLREYIPRAQELDVTICNGQCTGNIANALDQPAPRLRSLWVDLGDRVEAINRLVCNDAPLLTRLHMRSWRLCPVQHFPSLRFLDMQITKAYHATLISMLKQLEHVDHIELVWEGPVPDNFLVSRPSITLIHCRSFTLRNISVVGARCMMNKVHLLAQGQVHVHLVLNDHELSTENLSLPAFTLHTMVSPNAVTVELREKFILVQLNSWPSYSFYVPLDHELFRTSEQNTSSVTCLTRIISSFMQAACTRAVELAIYKAPSSSNFVLPTSDLSYICLHILMMCPSLQVLELFGDLEAALLALLEIDVAHSLPYLKDFHIGDEEDPSEAVAELLMTVQARGMWEQEVEG